MKKKFNESWLIVIVALAPVIYLAIIWNTIPSTVALHFNGHLEPDRMGDKSELWLPVGIMAVVSIGVFFLFKNISRIDPKRRNMPRSSTFQKLAAGIVLFLSVLNFTIIISSFRGSMAMTNLMFPILGLLFAFIGNYMNSIKPNYFAGFRLPWTLSSDENWRKTHQLASKIWFAGGILIAIIALIVPADIFLPLFIGLTFVMVIIPSVYSYLMFRKERKRSEQ